MGHQRTARTTDLRDKLAGNGKTASVAEPRATAANSEFTFAPATKMQRKARVFLSATTGGGKTWTSLLWANVLGQRVGLIDTEHGLALAYADDFSFLHMPFNPPYSPDRYMAAITAAADAGIDALIVDSLSHAWAGKGGILEMVDQVALANRGDKFGSGWRAATPKHQDLIEALLAYPGHLICTARSKTDYAIEREDGRTKIVKLGMAPVQRDGMEYEFDVVGELSAPENILTISKTRCSALDGFIQQKPDSKLAEVLRDWLNTGAATSDDARPTVDELIGRADTEPDPDVLVGLYQIAERYHMLTTPVKDPDSDESTTLGEFIRQRGVWARKQAERMAREAANATVQPDGSPATTEPGA